MNTAVIGRAVGTGALAGAASGLVANIVLFTFAAVDGDPLTTDASRGSVGDAVGGLLSLALLTGLVGAAAGATLGVPVGLLLGALHPMLTGRTGISRAAGALACALVVGLLWVVLATIGTAQPYLWLLTVPAGVVTTIVGAWRGPRLVDGRGRPQDQDRAAHRR